MRKAIFIVAALPVLLISPAWSFSSIDSTALRLVKQGESLLAENKLKEAEQSFREALRIDHQLTTAMAGLGRVFIAKEDWGEANDWYEKILELEPENPDALYHRGICYRETGKFKALLMRKWDWDNSAKYFERVLAKDSLFLDTLYQYAQLLRYREDYAEAILMGHHQVRLKPELVNAQVGLFRLYQYLLDHRKEKEVVKWLQEHDSEHARYFLGETYRQAGKLDASDSLLQAWLAAKHSISAAPAHLSLARLNYQRGLPQAALKFFWQAVEEIANQVDAKLIFQDIKYIVNENELRAFRRLSAPQDYITFFRQMWTSRDPTPAADFNVRLAEHYRRLLYAEKNHLFDRFRTWFNNPDKLSYLKFPPTFYLNDRFDDKGLIYIRHGEPGERTVTVNPDLPANESWRYGAAESSPEMIFHFVIDENAAGNNWRVAPFINHPEFLEDRLTWGSVYHRLLRGDQLERLALEQEMAQQSAAAVDLGYRTDHHTWDEKVKPLDFSSYVAFFKAPERQSYFELYYGLPLPKSKELDATPDTTAIYEHGVALHDLAWNQIQRRNGEIKKERIAGIAQEQSLIGQYRFTTKPDSYHVAFFVRQPTTQRLEGWKRDFRIPDFSKNELAVSSIVLASSIAPASDSGTFVRNGLRIMPNPSRSCNHSQPVHVYFEVYHLQPDADGKTSFVIEYTTLLRKEKKAGAKKLLALFGSGTKPSTTLVTERQADATTSTEYLALDLSRAGKGEFQLSIKVKDKNSGNESEGFIDFALF
jgi:tetratricopeptide (TPR) repeat protein